ncbi:MAG: AAA family ATPase, partial [Flavobacterium sp.]
MNKQELEQKLADAKASLLIAKPTMKKAIEEEIADLEKQLANQQVAMPDMSAFMKTIMSTIVAQMSLGQGTGVDSPQVRAIIKEYLGKDKVQLNELDKAILDEIKKNQMITLTLPGYALEIEVDRETTDIPNFWEIVDDILAGNNVFLIGEAGGGKTYTAEQISNIIGRKYVTLNCSQYTSPLEILGGQSVEGFKKGKLIDCWQEGKILIMDEMPKLDPNTAGLFNDALAKSSKTRTNEQSKINSANAEEPPIQRN